MKFLILLVVCAASAWAQCGTGGKLILNPLSHQWDCTGLPGAGTGTVTNVSSGNLSPLFTASFANPTTTPALSFVLSLQNANKVFAGPASGADAAPTFRFLVPLDITTGLTGTCNAAALVQGDASCVATSGTGGVPRLISPVFTTPNIGAATASSVNNLTITSSSGTLTIAAAKVLTFSNTLTFTGTDGSSVAFGTGGTVVYSNVTTLSSLISIGTIGTGIWQATKVGLAFGGTNADLSATGGASQVLKQVSPGAAVTVARLACADLSDAGAGCTGSGGGITSLNGLSGASQTFVNDTNVSIVSSGTTHTVTWLSTLAKTRLLSTVVYTDQANTAATGMTIDLALATSTSSFRLANIAGATTTTAGAIVYDTTNKNFHGGGNGVDNIFGIIPTSISPANDDCAKWTVAAGVRTLNTAGAACGTGGSVAWQLSGGAVVSGTTFNAVPGSGISLAFTNVGGVATFTPSVTSTFTATVTSVEQGDILTTKSTTGNDSYSGSPAIGCSTTALTTGMVVNLYPDTANTGAATLTYCGLTTKNIKKADGSTDPANNDIIANDVNVLTYDGSVFRLPPVIPSSGGGGITALTSDVTASGSGSVAATVVNLPTGVTQAGSLLITCIAAPGTPASGKASEYCDSTSKNIAVKDDAGVVKHGVQTDTGAANNYISAISDTGAITKSRPACATLSDSSIFCTATGATNAQTATYQVLAADFNNLSPIIVASGTFTITLVASGTQPATGKYIDVINYGSGVVTIARSGQNINGGTTSLTLPAASGTAPTSARVLSDGTNYFAWMMQVPATTTCTNQFLRAVNGNAAGTCASVVQADLPATTKARGIPFTIGDPAGTALTVAATTTDYITVPFACTISAYNLLIDAGTITVKFWKVATGTAIPTSGNSISTSGVGIASGTAIHSATVSDFTTTTVTKDDILAMNITAVATAKYVQGTLQCDQ